MNEISELHADHVSVEVEDARSSQEDDADQIPDLARTVQEVLAEQGGRAGSASVYLVDVAEMTELNREYMATIGPTDVLSFPMDMASEGEPVTGDVHFGEIVLCVEVAAEQAPRHCGSLPAELQLLAVHGALHLLGHDHAEPAEKAVMQRLEADYLNRLGFQHPGNQK